MSEETRRAVTCLNCNADLPADWAMEVELPCPKCASRRLAITIGIVDKVSLHECLTGRVKDSNFNSRNNPRVIFKTGESYSRARKKWVKRDMLVDRGRDLYREMVIDPDGRTIIHKCDEPLSKHRGHGSARRSPSS